MKPIEISLSLFEKYTDCTLEEEIIRRVVKRLKDSLSKTIEGIITHQVMSIISETITQKVITEVDKILENGFTQTDSYGRQEKVVSVKDICINLLTNKNYYSDRKIDIEAIIKSRAEKLVNSSLESEITEIRKKFRSAIEEKFGEVLLEEIKRKIKL